MVIKPTRHIAFRNNRAFLDITFVAFPLALTGKCRAKAALKLPGPTIRINFKHLRADCSGLPIYVAFSVAPLLSHLFFRTAGLFVTARKTAFPENGRESIICPQNPSRSLRTLVINHEFFTIAPVTGLSHHCR